MPRQSPANPKKRKQKSKARNKDAYWYVGRFLYSFGMIASQIDNLLCLIYNLNAAASLMLISNLDFRKKMQVIQVGLNSIGIDANKILSEIHKLADLRNVVAHSSFDSVPESIDKGAEWGIDFDYVNLKGECMLPGKKRTKEFVWYKDTFIKYSEFDAYEDQATNVSNELARIEELVTPIVDVDARLRRQIEEAVGSSDNIIRFRRSNDK